MDEAERTASSNKYCDVTVLRDEASVEPFFVTRLLKDLGYKDKEIHPKQTLRTIAVAKGRRKENYRPDYALVCSGAPRWIIDAKSPKEKVEKWAYQGAGYALGLNQEYRGDNPCQFYAITNGLEFNLYKWDEKKPVLEMSFTDFVDDNQQFLALQSLVAAKAARSKWEKAPSPSAMAVLRKPSIEEVKRVFNTCHQLIWKTEKMNPQPAFFEFVKVMFVKLWEDRRLHDDPVLGDLLRSAQPIPKDRVVFSEDWIDSVADEIPNPINDVLFKKLRETLEEGVLRGNKKPIFADNEQIRLQRGTIKQVVSKLESLDMFGIDEDLNGRLFETFLSATMRGQSLGQYFTPRSIAKLITRLANPIASRERIDRVLDGCCGTGGFLIEALTDMRNQIRENTSLSDGEAKKLLEQVANESLFGIDAGREPPVARIARINMYLHGDGGTRIYAADTLDKTAKTGVEDDPQSRREVDEWRELVDAIGKDKSKGFRYVLSNPPFSMGYSDAIENEEEILRQYELDDIEGTDKHRPSLTSNIMFIERYADLLQPGGELITVIDDSVLSGPKLKFARDFIRRHFVVRAVISLPGDAFQRVGARAKTSVLFLRSRLAGEKDPRGVFMYECEHVGLDDKPVKARASVVADARQKAEVEMKSVIAAFRKFEGGKKGPWLVPAATLIDRLDVKFCLPRKLDVADSWERNGLEVVSLSSVVEHIDAEGFNPSTEDHVYTLLRVRYDGVPEEGEKALGSELTYSQVQHPKAGDIVASNIAIGLGSTAVMPKELTHTIVSHEFTIMRVKDKRCNPWFLWGYLRSPEVRARLMSLSSGTNRQRVNWEQMQSLPVPLVDQKTQNSIGRRYQKAISAVFTAERQRAVTTEFLDKLLDLDNEWARQRLTTAKPPK